MENQDTNNLLVEENGSKDEDKSLIEHLEELRKTLIQCILSVVVILPFSFYFSPNL